MAEIYGNTWTNAHGERPTPLWIQMIDALTDEQVRRGFQMCVKDASAFPPSIGQFMSWAKPVVPPYHAPAVPLLEKARNLELARKHLAEMKARLKR